MYSCGAAIWPRGLECTGLGYVLSPLSDRAPDLRRCQRFVTATAARAGGLSSTEPSGGRSTSEATYFRSGILLLERLPSEAAPTELEVKGSKCGWVLCHPLLAHLVSVASLLLLQLVFY